MVEFRKYFLINRNVCSKFSVFSFFLSMICESVCFYIYNVREGFDSLPLNNVLNTTFLRILSLIFIVGAKLLVSLHLYFVRRFRRSKVVTCIPELFHKAISNVRCMIILYRVCSHDSVYLSQGLESAVEHVYLDVSGFRSLGVSRRVALRPSILNPLRC